MTFLWATVIPPKGMACDQSAEDGQVGSDPVEAGAILKTSGGLRGEMEIFSEP